MSVRIGIDTGGTFTDLVAIDDRTAEIQIVKVPSTPANPVLALSRALTKLNLPLPEVRRLVLGTTVATNAILQRDGARVVLITTAGFEDVLFIQRANRRFNYDLRWQKPQPLARRRHCLGVRERIDHRGNVLLPLTMAECEHMAAEIQRLASVGQIDAIAICLLFAYVNPAHELALAAHLRASNPDLPVSLSHQLAPVWREYERANTTVVDAFIKPLVTSYVNGSQRLLEKIGVGGAHCLMKSNGGAVLLEEASHRPVDALISGLVGGIVAGAFFARIAGAPDAVTLDVGGTSSDVGLVTDCTPRYVDEFEVEWGSPVVLPVVAVNTIGAGGGSIIWLDRGGFLRVGPQSAGATPGPACYGKGGDNPTITDAQLVLGRINPGYFLGGAIPLQAEHAKHAIDILAERLALSRYETAAAAIAIANDAMANTIRLLTVQQGIDPRNLALVAFGGAGPLHACGVARNLGIRQVIVPIHPGLGSALGTLIADVRVDTTQTVATRSDRLDVALLQSQRNRLVEAALRDMRRQGYEQEPVVSCTLSMRYAGQNYEQAVPLEVRADLIDELPRAYQRFHSLHEQSYGFQFTDVPLEIVAIKVSAIGPAPTVELPHRRNARQAAPFAWRDTHLDVRYGIGSCPCYRRHELAAAATLVGPVLVEEIDSTTWLPPGATAVVDVHGNLLIDAGEPA